MKKLLASLLAVGFVYVCAGTPINKVLAQTTVNGGIASGNDPVREACTTLTDGQGFCSGEGTQYWYENNRRQGIYGDPKNIIDETYGVERGREIYDPTTNAWYWLDANNEGAKAVGKEGWMPYIYQDEDQWSEEQREAESLASDEGLAPFVLTEMNENHGKWVRYDGNGKMLKGWVTIEGDLAAVYPEQAGNRYYYDNKTGAMAKGYVTINGVQYHFDENTGVLQ